MEKEAGCEVTWRGRQVPWVLRDKGGGRVLCFVIARSIVGGCFVTRGGRGGRGRGGAGGSLGSVTEGAFDGGGKAV